MYRWKQRRERALRSGPEQELPRESFRWIRLLFWSNLIAIPASALLYGERFDVVSHPLSWLGNPSTSGGLPNQRGMLTFEVNLLFSSFVCLRLARLSWWSGSRLLLRVVASLFLLAAVGLIVTMAPCATHDPVHRMGAGLMTTSFWLLGFVLLYETRRYARCFWFYPTVVANHLFLYLYAAMFFANRPAQTLLQKAAFFGLLWNLYLPARRALAHAAREAPEPELGLELREN
ncbi:MAG: hypothetical protein QHJ34_13885 [bacterium]|jgi:hypothetical protein|nr:hypothetical protein [candidate division KSB1 bacterium]MDH7561302.1 hypothetical protein [bacterium]